MSKLKSPAVKMSITVTPWMSEKVKELVSQGTYSSESEVFRDGLRKLFSEPKNYLTPVAENSEAVELWLRNQVVPAISKLKADPSRAVPIEEAFVDINEELSGDFNE